MLDGDDFIAAGQQRKAAAQRYAGLGSHAGHMRSRAFTDEHRYRVAEGQIIGCYLPLELLDQAIQLV